MFYGYTCPGKGGSRKNIEATTTRPRRRKNDIAGRWWFCSGGRGAKFSELGIKVKGLRQEEVDHAQGRIYLDLKKIREVHC